MNGSVRLTGMGEWVNGPSSVSLSERVTIAAPPRPAWPALARPPARPPARSLSLVSLSVQLDGRPFAWQSLAYTCLCFPFLCFPFLCLPFLCLPFPSWTSTTRLSQLLSHSCSQIVVAALGMLCDPGHARPRGSAQAPTALVHPRPVVLVSGRIRPGKTIGTSP